MWVLEEWAIWTRDKLHTVTNSWIRHDKFFSDLISLHHGDQHGFYSTINTVLSINDSSFPSQLSLDLYVQFQNCFLQKVQEITSMTLALFLLLIIAYFCFIEPSFRYTIFMFPWGPHSSWIVCWGIPGSCSNIMNTSLFSFVVPFVFKHAGVQPMLKKQVFDSKYPSIFYPLSKIEFLLKVMDKAV